MNMIYKLTISLITIFIVCMPFCAEVIAGATNDIINRETQRRKKMIKEVLKAQDGFSKYKKGLEKKISGYKQLIASIKTQHADKFKKTNLRNSFIKSAPQALVFVSFSMPDLSLNQIIRDADYYQIPVVIRGLYKNSFKKTFEKVFNLVKEKNKGGILINPRWFREYKIKSVPALVVNVERMGKKTADVVYGNIPIKRVLSIVAERGENHEIAKAILNKGGK